MTKKRRRLKKKPVAILILIILTLIFMPIAIKKFNNNEPKVNKKNESSDVSKKNDEKKIKYKAITTDESEQNPEKVKKYYADGMSTKDYKNSIEKLDNYVTKTGKYKNIVYDFEEHLSYDELEKIYEDLALSDIVKLEIIGKSVDGRNLYSIEIGTGKKVTMFEAGIHAAEIASPLFITKFMVNLVNGYEDGDKAITNLLKQNKIVVLPVVNPDGYEAALFGTEALNNQELYLAQNGTSNNLKYLKSNANGVDLNRNFPSQTSGLYYTDYNMHYTVSLKPTTNKYSYFSGDTLGSEPETKAMIYWQNKWADKLKSYVALHSAGRVIYNGKPYLSDEYNDNSNKCANIVGDITNYEVLSKNDEDAGLGNDGTSSEYMAETLSGFTFSTKTGRLSSDWYAKKYDSMKYENTCVIVIESLENYTVDLDTIKNEYYKYDLEDAYIKVIERD